MHHCASRWRKRGSRPSDLPAPTRPTDGILRTAFLYVVPSRPLLEPGAALDQVDVTASNASGIWRVRVG